MEEPRERPNDPQPVPESVKPCCDLLITGMKKPAALKAPFDFRDPHIPAKV
jgi:hypothetical protein